MIVKSEMKRLNDSTLTRVIQEYALEHHPVEVNEGAVIEFDTAKLYSYITSKYYEMGYSEGYGDGYADTENWAGE